MPKELNAIRDRESRVFTYYQAVTDLLSPDADTRRQDNPHDHVDFFADEYAEARQEMRRALHLS